MKVDKILCMRAIDAPLVADGTSYDSKCATCGHNVCVAPTSLPIIAENPGVELVCNECIGAMLKEDDEVVPNPAGMAEAARTIAKARCPICGSTQCKAPNCGSRYS